MYSNTPRRRSSAGFALIEALVAVLIFSLGILGMVGVSAMAINAQSDAQYRTDASALANEMVQRIWLGVDRTNAATLQASLLTFQHQATEDPPDSCKFSGDTSDRVEDWVESITGDSPRRLPGATTEMQQIVVDTSAGSFNRVLITLCWQTASDAVPRRHTMITMVN